MAKSIQEQLKNKSIFPVPLPPLTHKGWKNLDRDTFLGVLTTMEGKDIIDSPFIQAVLSNEMGLFFRRAPFPKGELPTHLKPFSEALAELQTGRGKLSPEEITNKMKTVSDALKPPFIK